MVVLAETDFGDEVVPEVLFEEVDDVADPVCGDGPADDLQYLQSFLLLRLHLQRPHLVPLHHLLLPRRLPEYLVHHARKHKRQAVVDGAALRRQRLEHLEDGEIEDVPVEVVPQVEL